MYRIRKLLSKFEIIFKILFKDTHWIYISISPNNMRKYFMKQKYKTNITYLGLRKSQFINIINGIG